MGARFAASLVLFQLVLCLLAHSAGGSVLTSTVNTVTQERSDGAASWNQEPHRGHS